MAESPNLTNLVNLVNQTTAVTAINANNAAIATAFEDVLSISGTQPNQMGSTLDMNSNNIINLAAPINLNDAVRFTDLQASGSSGAASAALASAVGQAQAAQTAAAGSATTAAGSATTAAGSATSAATSATNSATSASSAAASAASIIALPVWSNTRLAKTSNYTVASGDAGKTICLGGSAYYSLTFGSPSGYPTTFLVEILNEDSNRGKQIILTGLNTFILWPGQSAVVYNQNNVWRVDPVWQRWGILSPTFYVDPINGNDNNDGLATGTGAFLTIQAAVNNLSKNVDLIKSGAVIQLADGQHNVGGGVDLTYPDAVGFAVSSIQGNLSSPDNVLVVCSPGGSCFFARDGVASWNLNGMQLKTTGNGSQLLSVSQFSVVDCGALAPVNFNSAPGGSHIVASTFGAINMLGNYSVYGGSGAHINCSNCGYINYGSFTVTGASSLTFGTFALCNNCGIINAGGVPMSFSGFGAVTGTKYIVGTNGVISSSGTNYPGNTGGSSVTGGQYS